MDALDVAGGLTWELQSSGVWLGFTASVVVGQVFQAPSGDFDWRLRIVAGPHARSSGRENSAADARSAADRQWALWVASHGLRPVSSTGTIDAGMNTALAVYQRERRAVIERDYHDAYDTALIGTVIEAFEHALGGLECDPAWSEATFRRRYAAAKAAIDASRSAWKPLLSEDGVEASVSDLS